jgi:hypothetical protein
MIIPDPGSNSNAKEEGNNKKMVLPFLLPFFLKIENINFLKRYRKSFELLDKEPKMLLLSPWVGSASEIRDTGYGKKLIPDPGSVSAL